MTPKEKAEELVSKYYDIEWLYEGYNIFMPKEKAKQCALIAVDEVLKAAFYSKEDIYGYYIEVKQEIEKL